ncbi:hypothetical protein HD806DRAFT_92645 [Xylariaceae sp. AK1471]|nr:hypothetical protein HD806DRAFT_92645 [Xylariaceae sp. AK1471]
MEPVLTRCNQCNHQLGSLINLWVQIGKSYISPVVQTEDALEISPKGVVRRGEKQTIVDGCRVQEVACNNCHSTLGSKCISSTVNHVLHEGQLLLRTSSIQIYDLSHYATIKPVIQRVLKLKNPPVDGDQPCDDSEDDDHGSGSSEDCSHKQSTNENPGLSRILNNINAQREDIERLDTAGYQIVASFNQAVQHIDDEIRKLKNEMAQMTERSPDNNVTTRELADDILSLKMDIKAVKQEIRPIASHSHLEQEISSIRNLVAEASESLRLGFADTTEKHNQKYSLLESNLETTRRDLKGFQTLLEGARATAMEVPSASNANADEIIALKAELQYLKQELVHERSYKSSSANTVFPSRELDILTSNITKIGQRASQVETLRMEFELLKGRVQRIETQIPALQKDAADLQRREPLYSRLPSSKRKCSPDYYLEEDVNSDVPGPNAPNTRDNHISWSSSPTVPHRSVLNTPPAANAPKGTAKTGVPRLTKSGTVDKRTVKKHKEKSVAPRRKAKG